MSKIVDFKKFLSKDNKLTPKLYFGDFNHEQNQGLEQAVKELEIKISKAIDRNVIGMLWTSAGLNTEASLDDINKSINLIIKAQATLDSLPPYKEQETERPIAMNFMNTPADYLEEMDPDKSQRAGVQTHKLPLDLSINNKNSLNQDTRLLELSKL